MEVNSSQKCHVEPYDSAMQLVPQLSAGAGFHVLLVADAPIDVPELDHAPRVTPGSGPESSRVLGTLSLAWTSLDLAVLGSAHVVSGLSC